MAAPPVVAQQFGGVAAVADGQVLVGEPGNQTLPGIVYVYERSGSGWTEAARLTVSAIDAPPDGFGRSLDADGSMAVIGAPAWDGGRGAAMIYQRNQAGEWSEVARLSPDGLGDDARFGSAVTIDGGMVLVAAAGANEGAGAVHVFTGSGADWTPAAEVLPMEGAGQGFGTGLAFAGSYAEGRAWFIANEPVRFEDRDYARTEGDSRLNCDEVVRVGEFGDVPLFADRRAEPPFEFLHVPFQPGIWRSYRRR